VVLRYEFVAFMIAVQNMENLLNEVSPQVTPFSLAQVRPGRFDFTFPFQQRDWNPVQSRACA
jgi:hypothetical protein